MERFWQQLETFLQTHGNLRFELDKDRLIFQEETILTEPPEEGNLPFTLFRDGIQWLEFQDGIEAKEIEGFLRIINKYRHLSDEPEGGSGNSPLGSWVAAYRAPCGRFFLGGGARS